MKKLILIASIIFLTSNAYSQNDSISHHARQLLYLTGADKIGVQMMNNMITSFKKNMSSVPDKLWDELSKEFKPDDLIELMVPIYVKYYSDKELVDLISFYKTPLGQKVIVSTALITQDSFGAGQEWGKKVAQKALAKLKEEGYMNNESPNQ
jgi:uncharacterized protein